MSFDGWLIVYSFLFVLLPCFLNKAANLVVFAWIYALFVVILRHKSKS